MHGLTQGARRSVDIFGRRPRAAARLRPHLSISWRRAAHPRRATQRTTIGALALLTAVGIVLGGNSGLAQTAGPTSDPLRGERRLLPIDDAVFTTFPDNGSDDQFTWILGGFNPPIAEPLGASDNPSLGMVSGKMFALPRDTFIVAANDLDLIVATGSFYEPSFGKSTVSLPHPLPAPIAGTAVYRPLMAMADFTGDGYDELVIGSKDHGLQVATPVDLTDPSKGLRWGAFLDDINTIPGGALATGDFDGDGLPEVALAYPVGGGIDDPGTQFRVEIYKVDPTQLSLSFQHSVTVDSSRYSGGSFAVQQVSIAAGDFDSDVSSIGLQDQELVVAASGVVENENWFALQPFQVFSTLQPVPSGGQAFSPFGCETCYGYTSAVVDSARLDWTGPLEQIVVGVNALDSDFNQKSAFWIATVDDSSQLSLKVESQTDVGLLGNNDVCKPGIRGLAIGNFTSLTKGKTPSIPSVLEIGILQGFNLGAALGGEPCRNDLAEVLVGQWVANTSNWQTSYRGVNDAQSPQPPGQQTIFSLVAGSYAGGSLWLGPPSVVPLEDLAQLEVVLQAPPMHLDFIQPVGETSAALLDLSFGLPGFNTKFTESSGTTTSTSHQSTTSNTFAEKESLDDSLSFGIPDVASVSATLKETSEQTQKEVVSKSANTITSTVESITAASDLDDRLWYTMHDVDLYIYPLLCPPDLSTPDTCGTKPSDLMFSVPQKQTLYSFVPGASVEWYQPPHQVAQALSYPWSKAQLEALFPTATLDTKLEVPNLPAAGPLNTTFAWTGVGETTKSIGKTRTLSTDTSVSISTDANASIDIFSVGGKSSESFSFSTSHSTSTLNTTETKITGSIGFETNVPDASNVRSGSNPDYAYDFDVLVFGQKHPPCPTSESAADAASPVTCLYDERTLQETITTQGTLWAGYTIDLSNGGNWWTSPATDYFTMHDIALSHPQRWVRKSSQTTGDNCLLDAISDSEFCYVKSADSLQRAEIWSNEFYQMKGFLVVPAARDEGGEFLAPQGPQTAVIDAGGQVWLQARVHNYSFVATDKNRDGSAVNGNSVHVRFYAQEWDATNHVPLAGKSSVLVEEVVLDQCIPGHSADSVDKAACSNGGSDNWLLATTSKPFDPVAAGIDPGTSGTYVLFWVVAWLEDGSGALVPEVVEHGLTALPGDLTSLTDAAPLSQTYGNNIGFFHLPTFVCPKNADCSNVSASGTSTAASAEAGPPAMRIARLRVPRKPVAVHEPMEVKGLLAAGDVTPRSVQALLYEGDPDADGTIFDVELAPYLRANGHYAIRANYRPDSCGPREIALVADPGGGLDKLIEKRTVNVSADPRLELAALQSVFAEADLQGKQRRAVAKDLRDAARAFRRGKVMRGMAALENLRRQTRQSGAVPPLVDAIEARIDTFTDCVAAAGGRLAHAHHFR